MARNVEESEMHVQTVVTMAIATFAFASPDVASAQESGGADVVAQSEPTGVDDGSTAAGRLAAAGWSFDPTGFVRVAYENVQRDDSVDFVGRSNGFRLLNARIGVVGAWGPGDVSFEVTVDGAIDTDRSLNTLEGSLEVRLRDGWLRWDPVRWVGLQAGQFVAPLSREAQRSTGDLLLSTRALGEEGVGVGTGLELPAVGLDRELGAMVSPQTPVDLGPVQVDYRLAVVNGNGDNALLNDNNSVAVVGRLEVGILEVAHLGGGVAHNQRTAGLSPNRFVERDLVWVADAGVDWRGLEVYGQLLGVRTALQTEGTPDREQQAWHVQAGYAIPLGPVTLTPAYRYATLDPWASGGRATSAALETYGVEHHTAGLRVLRPLGDGDLRLHVDYTFTVEHPDRTLRNNLLRVLAQVSW